jgi:hypothetical protein
MAFQLFCNFESIRPFDKSFETKIARKRVIKLYHALPMLTLARSRMRINCEYGQALPQKLTVPNPIGASVVSFFQLLTKVLHVAADFPKWNS